MIAAVRDTIRRHAMLAGGEAVLVAVSGGADSIGLLHALRVLSEEYRLQLSVVHVDHGLRPDSGDDAVFVDTLARSLGLPVAIERIAVPGGGSLEASARQARYAALRRQAARLGADRVALGHTADDQAETVLMRLLEGAGPRGLAGIPPVRDLFIRPLIETRRSEVVAELARAGLAWREDPSNRDPQFKRNRIRHELLPLLAASYNPAIVPALTRAAALIRDLLDRVVADAARELATSAPASGRPDAGAGPLSERRSDLPGASTSPDRPDAVEGPLAASTAGSEQAGVSSGSAPVRAGEIVLSRARLSTLPGAVAAEVLRMAAERLGHVTPLRAWAHRGLRRVLLDPPPRCPLVLGAVTIEVSGDRVRLSRHGGGRVLPRPLAIPGLTSLPEAGCLIEARCFDRPAEYVVPRTADRVAFDADALSPVLRVRSRRPGDRFVPFGGERACRLKSLLIDARVPRWERDSLPLVVAGADGAEIVWIAGLRRSALAPVSASTRRVLELRRMPLAKDTVAE